MAKFPSRADTAAALLIDLHEGRGGAGGGAAADPLGVSSLQAATRHDALTGLALVLRAVKGLDPQGADACVARVLDHLTRCVLGACFVAGCVDSSPVAALLQSIHLTQPLRPPPPKKTTRLLGELAESGADLFTGSDEAEEGEVDDRAALVALARAAFVAHPHRVLAFCVGCLAKPDRSSRGERDAKRGARLVLTRLALMPPPRGAGAAGAGGFDADWDDAWEDATPEPGAGGAGSGGGRQRPDAAHQGGPDCWLARVLRSDEGLQQWVTSAAAASGRAPSEARQMLDRFVALLPPPPLPDSPPPSSPSQPEGSAGGLQPNGSLARNGTLPR